MTFTDAMIFLAGWTGASVVAVAPFAISSWIKHDRKEKAERAFQELDAAIIADIQAYPNLRKTADELAEEARKARTGHKASREAAERAIEARKFQMLCEMRLKAAGYDIVMGEVA